MSSATLTGPLPPPSFGTSQGPSATPGLGNTSLVVGIAGKLRTGAQQHSGPRSIVDDLVDAAGQLANGIATGSSQSTQQGLAGLSQVVNDTLKILQQAGFPVGKTLPTMPNPTAANGLRDFKDFIETFGLQGFVRAVDRTDLVNGMSQLKTGLGVFAKMIGMQGGVSGKMLRVCDDVSKLGDHTLAYLQSPSSGTIFDQAMGQYHLLRAGMELQKLQKDLGALV